MPERLAERLARAGIPELGGLVVAARGDDFAVGAEGHGVNVPLMLQGPVE